MLKSFLVVAAAVWVSGCAGYAGSVEGVRSALLAGDKNRALGEVNKALDVKAADEMPEKLSGDNALLVLERGTVKQGLEKYKSAAADFRASDKHLELLDLKNDTMGNIGKYLFSDDVTVYKAPAYEKLLLNTLNILNYLGAGDLEGARVEARRLKVMQDYLADAEPDGASLSSLGSYLAGLVFEMSGKPEQALNYYSEALTAGSYPSLTDPILRLASCTSFRTDAIEKVLTGGEKPAQCEKHAPGKGTILVISGTGLAPYKVAKRIPIGAAIVIAGAYLGALETERAQRFAARGLLTFINFPVLEKTPEYFSRTEVTIDGRQESTEQGMHVTEEVIRSWDGIKGRLMVAAITRMITRLAAGVATEQAVKSAGGGGIGSLLAGLAVQGALTAADTPDTRSWVTLPSRIFITRAEVPVGTHQISIAFEGNRGQSVITKTVDVAEGGIVVIPVTSMR